MQCATTSYNLDVAVTRGSTVESVHRVAAAVVCDDTVIGAARDANLHAFWRSCAKPFQIMPLIKSGQLDAVGWGIEQIALACASHGGEPEHVVLVEKMLENVGLREEDLACGATEPLTPRGVRILQECGRRPTRLHNNCSGKHAAMLARAVGCDWPTEGYHRLEHPVQQSVLAEVESWTGASRDEMDLAVDGCGVVVFGLALTAMARAYSRLGSAARRGDEIPGRIVNAMLANPFLVGGTDRFDTVLMDEAPGVLCKIGAEGVHSAAIIESGIGIALKVEDGNARAQYPALLALLQYLGALPDQLPPRLTEIAHDPVRNTRHEIVGKVALRASV